MTDYVALAKSYASQLGIDQNIFVAQIQAESGFNPNVTSPAGAQGIAQFMPATAAGMGVNPWDANSALKGAATLDRNNLRAYNGDYAKALAAYNAGGGAVNSAVARYGNNWLSGMPKETQSYVANIMKAKTGAATTGSTAPTTVTTPVAASSTPDILSNVKQWGEYVAIFFMALLLVIIGLLLVAGKQTTEIGKKIGKAAIAA